jgi:hypothetical protein
VILSERLSEYVGACFTGLWVQSYEHEDALAEMAQMCRNENWHLATWDIDGGLQIPGQGGDQSPDTGGNDPLAAIRSINALASPDSRRYCLRSARRFHCRCRGRPTPFGNVPVTVREANTACFAPKSMIIPTQAIEGLYGRCAGCLLQGYASALSALCQPLDPRNVCALEGDDSRSRPKTQIDLGFQLLIPGPPDRPGGHGLAAVCDHMTVILSLHPRRQ